MKRCTKCQETKDRSSFNAHRYTSDGLQSWCRSCKTEQMRNSRMKENSRG